MNRAQLNAPSQWRKTQATMEWTGVAKLERNKNPSWKIDNSMSITSPDLSSPDLSKTKKTFCYLLIFLLTLSKAVLKLHEMGGIQLWGQRYKVECWGSWQEVIVGFCGSPTLSWDWSTLCVGLLDSAQRPASNRRETFFRSSLFTAGGIFANATSGHNFPSLPVLLVNLMETSKLMFNLT